MYLSDCFEPGEVQGKYVTKSRVLYKITKISDQIPYKVIRKKDLFFF